LGEKTKGGTATTCDNITWNRTLRGLKPRGNGVSRKKSPNITLSIRRSLTPTKVRKKKKIDEDLYAGGNRRVKGTSKKCTRNLARSPGGTVVEDEECFITNSKEVGILECILVRSKGQMNQGAGPPRPSGITGELGGALLFIKRGRCER